MSNLGIGIGSFVQGFANGMGMRRELDESRARTKALDREQANQDERDKFEADSRKEFDQGVAAGKFKPDDVSNFMLHVKGPERAALLVKQGDYAGAKAWQDWYRSDAAQEGTKLFGSALFKAQSGNLDGAIDDAVKAGQVNGYLDHNYELAGKDPIKAADGSVGGYRVRLRDTKMNEELHWDVTPDNVVDGIATLFNPEAAYQSRLEAQKLRDKAKLDIETYGVKAGIDDRYDQKKEDRKFGYDVALAKQKKKLGIDSNQPADVATAEWLAEKNASAAGRPVSDQDRLDAYNTVRQAKDNPNGRAALVVRVYEGMQQDFRDHRPDEVKRAAARQYVDDLFAEQGDEGVGATGVKEPTKPKRSPKPVLLPGSGGPKEMPAGGAKGAAPSPDGAIDAPDYLLKEPDGTIVKDDAGRAYELRDGKLLPKAK